MKLLFDQNISFRLIKKITDTYHDSKHLSEFGLSNQNDQDIWNYARLNGYIIVTFDSDFYDIALIKGYPPKVIWLRLGNLSTDQIAELLKKNYAGITDFVQNPDNNEKACLELG